MIYTIHGKVPGVTVVLDLPDDTPDGELDAILKYVQKFADEFKSKKEFEEVITTAGMKNQGTKH